MLPDWLTRLFGPRSASNAGSADAVSDQRIDEWMRDAYELHQSGRISDAEDRYRMILRTRPSNVDALYLLGEIANRSGRHERAVEMIGKAIAANGEVAMFHHELGCALRSSGDTAGAEQSFGRAIELAPDDLESRIALGELQLGLGRAVAAEHTFREIQQRSPGLLTTSVNLGTALMAQERLDEAAESLNAALALDPLCVQALSNLGVISIKRKDMSEAQRLLERALEFDPLCYEARVNLAVVYQEQDRWDDAVRLLEEAARTNPAAPHARYALARAHWRRGAYAAAERSLRDVMRLAPDLIDAALDLGKVLHESGRVEEVPDLMRDVLRRHPGSASVHVSLGFALETLGEFKQAMDCYEQALAIEPDSIRAHVNRGMLRVLTGDFEHGWPDYEWRVRTEELADAYRRYPMPRWDGSALAGRTLLVHSEQGLGDEIMYASCIPEVIAQAGHCVLECAHKLVPVFSRSFPQATVRGIPSGDTAEFVKNVPPIDIQIPAGSLPLHLRRKAADFPRERAYLKADPVKVIKWRTRLAKRGPGLKVGLSWRGGVPLTGIALRSIPLERLRPFLRQEGVCFVSLQYGDIYGELDDIERSHGISVRHWQLGIDSYEETAALMCALDLTISVCTAIVHLGGALGRPVWTLAPLRPESRYGASGTTMPWYASVRMFRQPRFGDWDSVIGNVAMELAALVAQPAGASSSAGLTAAR